MVDCGVTFGDHYSPGIDLIFADHQFIKERQKDLVAIILTHAHEDHIGAIAHIWPDLKVPIYATAFTEKMVNHKFADLGIVVGNFLNVIPLKAKFSLNPFDIEFISITHSIPEPNGILITTPLGKVYHTGDWKFDPDPVLGDVTDFKRLTALKSEKIDAVICDSTNALDHGVSGSEASILEPMITEIKTAPHGVAITTFASNIARVTTLIKAVHQSGRAYCLLGRSLERIYAIGRQMGYFDTLPEPIPFDRLNEFGKSEIAVICTGSQGEERAALAKMARGAHPMWNLNAGDRVIFSSKTIPGNEKSVSRILNQLAEKGVDVITSKIAPIHVSGHPCADELKQLYEMICPKYAIPVHGEERHMQRHAQIALQSGVHATEIPHNGDVIEIAPNFGWKNSVEAGRLYVDGRFIEPADHGATAERRRLTYAGCVAIFIHLSKRQKIVGVPKIMTWGVVDLSGKGYQETKKLYLTLIKEAVHELPIDDHLDDLEIAEMIRRKFRREVNYIWGKKPLTQIAIHRDKKI